MIYAVFNHTKQLQLLVRAGKGALKIPVAGNFISTMFEYVVRIVFASDISCKADISPDIIFVHGHDIVIGSDVKIGHGCKIFNGVTLGNKDTETTTNAQPIIEDNCVISTGVKILGKITIGAGSIIGANSVVLHDIPPNSIAVGIPARVVRVKEDHF